MNQCLRLQVQRRKHAGLTCEMTQGVGDALSGMLRKLHQRLAYSTLHQISKSILGLEAIKRTPNFSAPTSSMARPSSLANSITRSIFRIAKCDTVEATDESDSAPASEDDDLGTGGKPLPPAFQCGLISRAEICSCAINKAY